MADSAAIQRARLDAQRLAFRRRVAEFRNHVDADRGRLEHDARYLLGDESPMAEHPRVTVAASFGAGFVAAMLPAHLPHPELPLGPAKAIASKGAGAGVDVLKVEAGVVLRDFIDAAFSRHQAADGVDVSAAREPGFDGAQAAIDVPNRPPEDGHGDEEV